MYLNNKIIFVLLILVTITTTSVFGGNKKKKVIYVNVGDYHTCIPLLFRPQHTAAVPSQTIQLFGETFTATRHHIIPYSTLATFFNLVLREDPVSELGAYLARRVVDIWNFYKKNDGAGAYTPGTEPRVLSCDSMISATFNVDNRMLAAFTWMPGNIFYGPPPERCTNDPVEFEEDAERIVGIEAFTVLSRIYFNMQNYINNLSERTTRNFDAILNDLSVVAERNTLHEFNQTDWVVAGWDGAGNKLFGIKKTTGVIKRIIYGNVQKLTKRWGIGIVGMCEDYMKAADRVCEEYTSHLVPKFNTNFTYVDIDSDILFVYSINNKHFVYGQNIRTNEWSVHAVEQDGMVGAVMDQGSWEKYYAVQFAFEIDGNHYFYGHDLKTKFWVIHELKADGTIGRETDRGYFGHNFQTQFYIYINGQHCLYGQTNNDHDKLWFLQKFNSDGTLGRGLFFNGMLEYYYDIQFPFKIGDRQYIARYNTDSRLHYIHEIGADIQESMGKVNFITTLDSCSYSVLFPVSLGGKTYLFGHTPKYWAVRQVFGDVIEENFINYEFSNAQPFNINGYQYFYARHKGASKWSLHYFDYKYLEDDVDM